MNETLEKFGYPATCVHESDHWAVTLRPNQATLGALMLITKGEARSFGDLDAAAAQDLPGVARRIEDVLKRLFDFRKINYLMLMMNDPQVHFHVLPRYPEDKTFGGVTFDDPGWPARPHIDHKTEIDDAVRAKLQAALAEAMRQS